MPLLAATLALLTCMLPTVLSLSQDLSPPWWLAYGMFHAALQQDTCLNVSSLEPAAGKPAFQFNITVCANASEEKLTGLATFLTVQYNFGGTRFVSHVVDSNGSTVQPVAVHSGKHAMKLAGAALSGNAYFVRTAISQPLPCVKFHWAVFQPTIAQLWIDNLADLWGNLNLLAEDLCDRVFGLEGFGVRATTLNFRSIEQQGDRSTDGRAVDARQSMLGEHSDGGSCAPHPELKLQGAGSSSGAGSPCQPMGGVSGAVFQSAQQFDDRAAKLLAGMQHQQPVPPLQLAVGGRYGRRQLASTVDWQAEVSVAWSTTVFCWAYVAARWLGAEQAVLTLQHWLS